MRIAVIAAQGRSGKAFVQEALAAGHEVRAGIRGEDPFAPDSMLITVQCDATNDEQVATLVHGCDAVVSLIGHVKGSDDFVQTRATKTIIAAMNAAGVRRFISLTGVGVWVPGDKFKAATKALNDFSALFGVKRFNDGIKHADVLAASNLDWTVVRVLRLVDGEPGAYHLKSHGFAKFPTPRREVARAILECLENDSFIHEYPVVARA